MYNLCEGILRLRDVAHERNGKKFLKLLKETCRALQDFWETSNTVEKARWWVQEVFQSNVLECEFQKKILHSQN